MSLRAAKRRRVKRAAAKVVRIITRLRPGSASYPVSIARVRKEGASLYDIWTAVHVRAVSVFGDTEPRRRILETIEDGAALKGGIKTRRGRGQG